jgi:hypothetical protein
VLELERPDLPRGEHRLEVSLRHGRATRLARSRYLD